MTIREALIWLLKVALNIGSIFLCYYLVKFLGWKGIIGLILGMFIMAYLLLSRNPILVFFTRMFMGNIDLRKTFEGDKIERGQDIKKDKSTTEPKEVLTP